jgi:hypothetical protein
MRRFGEGVALCAICGLLAACTQTSTKLAEAAPITWSDQSGKRVILVDPDVELSELTAGGMTEARADWTATGKTFIRDDIAASLQAKGISLVTMDAAADRHEVQLVKLHGAVGLSILQNALLNLPTKAKKFDWTLGPGVAAIRGHYHGDYALFVFVRDSYTTAGRALVMLGAAMLGVGIQGGQQIGFASLVDLHTGRIVWFNRLASSSGSLKEAKGAQTTVQNLLSGIPL